MDLLQNQSPQTVQKFEGFRVLHKETSSHFISDFISNIQLAQPLQQRRQKHWTDEGKVHA
jgi:hypothetical protein